MVIAVEKAENLNDSMGLEISERKFFFKVKDKVLATHRDLQTLRYCSNLLKIKPSRKIIIVGPYLKKHTNFMVNTLHHLGVSCGQIINANRVLSTTATPEGVWVLVTD